MFRVAQSPDGINWNHIGDTATTTYTATGLSVGVPVYFKVRAANGTVYSAYANVVSVTPTDIVRLLTGAYTNISLLSSGSQLALDVDATQGYINGNNVQLWTSNGDSNQKWNLLPNGDGTYTIVDQASGKVLDANGYAINQNGCKVQLWDSNNSPQQHWIIGQLADGSVVIRNSPSGLVLDANSPGDYVNGDLTQLWQYDAGSNQKWDIA